MRNLAETPLAASPLKAYPDTYRKKNACADLAQRRHRRDGSSSPLGLFDTKIVHNSEVKRAKSRHPGFGTVKR